MFVSTRTPCSVAMPPLGPSRLETVARWKVVKKKVKLRPRKVSESARRHIGCTTHPELPPPPPAFVLMQDAPAAAPSAGEDAPAAAPSAAEDASAVSAAI